MKTCQYRFCRRDLDPHIHGNSKYCISEENIKKSCFYREKLMRTKEYTAKKKKLEEMNYRFDEAIKIQLQGKKDKQILYERFLEIFREYLSLTTSRKINGSTVVFFGKYTFIRLKVSGKDIIKIDNSNEHEKNKD
jgi:hypothetical protein